MPTDGAGVRPEEKETGTCPVCRHVRVLTRTGRLFRHEALQQVTLRANHLRRFQCPGSGELAVEKTHVPD